MVLVVSSELVGLVAVILGSMMFFALGGVFLWACRTAHGELDDDYAVIFGIGAIFFTTLGIIILLIGTGQLVME
ncbi:MAG TPA: hypothetical protein VL854_14290 [Nitrososphaeraceae archaeon]|nr:hypothetical protein [Nitrososphaeraceae archaeon]